MNADRMAVAPAQRAKRLPRSEVLILHSRIPKVATSMPNSRL